MFDPERWLSSFFIHPTRLEMDEGHCRAQLKLNMKTKVRKWVEICKFDPDRRYHATVVIRGAKAGKEGDAMLTAMRVLCDAPLNFDISLSTTFHVQLGGGRPLIGLIATEEPLDRDSAIAQFPPSGDEASGAI